MQTSISLHVPRKKRTAALALILEGKLFSYSPQLDRMHDLVYSTWHLDSIYYTAPSSEISIYNFPASRFRADKIITASWTQNNFQ